jgi:hypothetical protein
MDGDLQDQPEERPRLPEEAKKGYDLILGRRIQRKDYFLKRLFSVIFTGCWPI